MTMNLNDTIDLSPAPAADECSDSERCPPGCECENCGEARMDFLAMDESGNVHCCTCHALYRTYPTAMIREDTPSDACKPEGTLLKAIKAWEAADRAYNAVEELGDIPSSEWTLVSNLELASLQAAELLARCLLQRAEDEQTAAGTGTETSVQAAVSLDDLASGRVTSPLTESNKASWDKALPAPDSPDQPPSEDDDERDE